ncbi:MAG: hypothetical protein IPL55_22960 [Saprospiraceae bacterium]|jgi:hypothetical protein|nr:hypothetical protein [Saprospiraceae bacterium]MBL0025306.1 hypothetical protein [Saprospiraceae bacterium]
MNQYTLTSTHRNILFGAMGLGLVCLVLTWIGDDVQHTRFWSNFLHNSVFFTMISVMALFFISACITSYAGWHTTFKRVWEAYSMFLFVGLALLLFIGLGMYMHWHHLYHWSAEEDVANDPILLGKSSFLNKNWYFFGTLIFVGIWAYFAYKIRSLSIQEDSSGNEGFMHHKSMKVYAAVVLPIIGFTSAATIWLWVMSIDAHWYSTLFAWYSAASAFVAMIALTILLIIVLKSNGHYKEVNENHLHDLGKYLFAISIFWTYLWFSQFMLIWYANIGEETIYFKERYNNYSALFFLNLGINFLVPFLVLMRNDTKRKFGSLIFVSIVVLLSHWLDYFLMIKPGALINFNHSQGHGEGQIESGIHGTMGHGTEHVSNFVSGFTIPGLLEIGTFIGFLGLFMYVALQVMTKSALVPKNDPYLDESMHHHVI